MTLEEFIKKWDGKTLDWDGAYGGQCVDLYRQYVQEVLNFPQSPGVVGAKDIWDSYLKDRFERIENSPTGIPSKGDIVIWGIKYGKFGHVGVFVEGDAKKFSSFDQNDPVGTKCHLQPHTYTGVLGWLTPKVAPAPELPTWFKGLLTENGIDPTNPEGKVREMFDQSKKYEQAQKERDRALRDLAEAKGDATKFEELHINAQKENKRLAEEIEDLRKSVGDRDAQITTLEGRVSALEKQLDPEKVIVLSREDYAVLTAKDQIKAASRWQLLRAIISKTFGRR